MDRKEIKQAVKELVTEEGAVYVLATVDEKNGPQCRYMGALVFEGDFEILMVSHSEARKMKQLKRNPNAQLLFASEGYKKVATLSGTAAVEESLDRKKQVWDAIPACASYHKSYDAPDFGLIRFKTKSIEYIHLAVQHEPFKVELR